MRHGFNNYSDMRQDYFLNLKCDMIIGGMGTLRQGPNYSDQSEKKVLACKVVSKDLRGSWR